jgi:hypothetical protein
MLVSHIIMSLWCNMSIADSHTRPFRTCVALDVNPVNEETPQDTHALNVFPIALSLPARSSRQPLPRPQTPPSDSLVASTFVHHTPATPST